MISRNEHALLAAGLVFSLGLMAVPAAAAKNVDAHVLILGNSLVRGLKPHLVKMFRDEGMRVKIKAMGPSFWKLRDHMSSMRTARLLTKEPWDYVIMASSSGGLDQTSYPEAIAMHGKVRGLASQATPLFLMTWFDESASLPLYDALKGVPNGDTGYVPIAFALDVGIAPAGWAIRNVIADGYPIDLWRKAAHLTTRGRFLVASVIYATLTGRSPVGLRAPRSFGPDAPFLQAVAADTVLADPAEWNLDP